MPSQKNLVKYENVIQVTSYDYPDYSEFTIINCKPNNTSNGGRKGKKASDVSAVDRQRTANRVKKDVRRYCLANQLYTHLTLTFAKDVVDAELADTHFEKFIKRLKHNLKDNCSKNFKYVATREIQEERLKRTGKAVIHYHVLINMPIWGHMFDSNKILELFANKNGNINAKNGSKIVEYIWGHGMIEIVPHQNNLKAINYICKYVVKSIEENLFINERGNTMKTYLSSKNLQKDELKSTVIFTNFSPQNNINEFYGMLAILLSTKKVEYHWNNEEEISPGDVRITQILINK